MRIYVGDVWEFNRWVTELPVCIPLVHEDKFTLHGHIFITLILICKRS